MFTLAFKMEVEDAFGGKGVDTIYVGPFDTLEEANSWAEDSGLMAWATFKMAPPRVPIASPSWPGLGGERFWPKR